MKRDAIGGGEAAGYVLDRFFQGLAVAEARAAHQGAVDIEED